MQDFSLIVQEVVLLVLLDANHALTPTLVLPAAKADSQSLMDHADQFVVMELLLMENNVMIETVNLTMDVHQPVEFKLYGHVLVNHPYVNTMAQLFVEMAVYKTDKNVMMEIP